MDYENFLKKYKNGYSAARFHCANLRPFHKKTWMLLDYETFLTYRNYKCVSATTGAVDVIRENDELFGAYADIEATSESSSNPTPHKIDVVAYCLNKEQTQAVFKSPYKPSIIQTTADILISLYSSCIYANFFSTYSLPRDQREKMSKLTKNLDSIKFLIVPYIDSIEEKENLYIKYQIEDI